MTITYRLPLSLLFVFCFLPGRAASLTDTTQKKLPVAPMRVITDQFGEYTAFLKEGITNIQQDSVSRGVHLINTAMQKAATLKPIPRVLDYQSLELFELLAIIDTGKISVAERQIGYAIMRGAFADKDLAAKKRVEDLIKKAPNTIFVKRVSILMALYEDRKKAETLLTELLKDAPSLISANILKAEILYNNEKYSDAVYWCNKTISLWPQYAHAYHVRAKSLGYINKGEDAIRDYDTAIKLFPQNLLFYYDRADALLDLEKYNEAINGFLYVKTLSPNYKWSNYNLARCYKAISNFDSAHYYVDRHMLMEGEDPDGYNLKGDIYYDQDNYAKAVQLHTQAINLDNTKASYYEDRGDDYYYADSVDNAIADYEKALKLNKNKAYANDRMGDCYYKKGEYEKAIPYHERAIKNDPEYKYAYLGMYYSYSKLGKLKQAIEACHKAIAIDSTYASALGNLGWAYYQTGEYDQCIKYSYKAVNCNERNSVYAMFNIALATLHKGEYAKAKELYRNFFTLCKKKDYKISNGAVDDLKDLIKQHIAEAEAAAIIKDVFNGGI